MARRLGGRSALAATAIALAAVAAPSLLRADASTPGAARVATPVGKWRLTVEEGWREVDAKTIRFSLDANGRVVFRAPGAMLLVTKRLSPVEAAALRARLPLDEVKRFVRYQHCADCRTGSIDLIDGATRERTYYGVVDEPPLGPPLDRLRRTIADWTRSPAASGATPWRPRHLVLHTGAEAAAASDWPRGWPSALPSGGAVCLDGTELDRALAFVRAHPEVWFEETLLDEERDDARFECARDEQHRRDNRAIDAAIASGAWIASMYLPPPSSLEQDLSPRPLQPSGFTLYRNGTAILDGRPCALPLELTRPLAALPSLVGQPPVLRGVTYSDPRARGFPGQAIRLFDSDGPHDLLIGPPLRATPTAASYDADTARRIEALVYPLVPYCRDHWRDGEVRR